MTNLTMMVTTPPFPVPKNRRRKRWPRLPITVRPNAIVGLTCGSLLSTRVVIPCITDEQADAVTKNPTLKLLFRLSKFYILDDGETHYRVLMTVQKLISNKDADELEWYVPSGIAISELERINRVIKQFLEVPIDLDGKDASELLSKKRRRRRRRSPSPASDDDAGDEPRRKKKEKKKKEKEQYKSAQFIEDSDEEYGGMDAFLEKEKAQREKASLAAAASAGGRPQTMKATGTKKRRRKADGKKPSKSKKIKPDERSPTSGDSDHRANKVVSNGSDADSEVIEGTAPMPRPRPRPLAKRRPSSPPPSSSPVPSASPVPSDLVKPSQKRSKRMILSDDE